MARTSGCTQAGRGPLLRSVSQCGDSWGGGGHRLRVTAPKLCHLRPLHAHPRSSISLCVPLPHVTFPLGTWDVWPASLLHFACERMWATALAATGLAGRTGFQVQMDSFFRDQGSGWGLGQGARFPGKGDGHMCARL